MNEKKNKIIFAVVLAMFFVGANFYFSDSEEKIQLEENVGENIEIEKNVEKNSETENAKKIFQVFVSGQVKNPAVLKLEDNGDLRLADAVNAAGGLTEFADTEIVNLAEPLIDGAHIHIPMKEIFLQESFETQISSPTSESDLVNINTADATELQKLYRVGPAVAKRIIEYREHNGKFQTVEDIKKVRGIGQRTFEKMKDKIAVQ